MICVDPNLEDVTRLLEEKTCAIRVGTEWNLIDGHTMSWNHLPATEQVEYIRCSCIRQSFSFFPFQTPIHPSYFCCSYSILALFYDAAR